MLELIFTAIGLGIMLSLVFIGPIFFLVIETSFLRGPKHALALDFGVLTADLMCIIAAYFATDFLKETIRNHPWFYTITAIIIFVYAIFMIISTTKIHLKNEQELINQNYIKTFFNGFALNFLNFGVILFWLITVITVKNQYPKAGDFVLYIAFLLGTYLCIDLLKILLAKQFHHKMTPKIANLIRNIVGVILVIVSIFIFLQSFAKFNQFDKKLEEAEHQQQKL
jgi:threonine/homoserine/homoserine lactone efflux protein